MFRELVDLGHNLEAKEKLPPIGFYDYREPIRWVVHLWWSYPEKVYLEETEIHRPRPYSGRTSGTEPHPFTDEAAYALGANKQRNDKVDARAQQKHKSFIELLEKALVSSAIINLDFKTALSRVLEELRNKSIERDPRFQEVMSKDWVSFTFEDGPLKETHLFEFPEAQAFWVQEMQQRVALSDSDGAPIKGECAICNLNKPLVTRLPLQVKLTGTGPLHSLNQTAFVSYIAGGDADKRAHLGLCFECGDTAARAFNYLSNSDQHRKVLAFDEQSRDSLANQIALFWLKAPSEIQIGERTFVPEDLLPPFTAPLAAATPDPELSQLRELLNLPWKAIRSALNLDEFAFYLAVLSPNVGRIALREWEHISLTDLRSHLSNYVQALSITDVNGTSNRPVSIRTLLDAAEIQNPHLTRNLIRTAYLGHLPPQNLLAETLAPFRVPRVRSEAWRMHALAAGLKLVLTYGKEEAETMEKLNRAKMTAPYLCGRLLAVLEEAQQQAHWVQHKKRLETTLVDRFYGSASTAPSSVFGNLIRLATTAHLPKLGRRMAELMEEVVSGLHEAGGFPKTLRTDQQAEFALGFYHQRADFRANRKGNQDQYEEGGEEE